MSTYTPIHNAAPYTNLPGYGELARELPCSARVVEQVNDARNQVRKILAGLDDRLLVVVGPCSIHDPKAALEYAERLATLAARYSNELCIVMRTYFEKPRTTVGWKGFIYDPALDGSGDLRRGLTESRQLLLDINALNLPAATEFLCPVNALYIADLISWGAIGARTTESQPHRELASALPCPVGFKNSTDGNIRVAMDAIRAAHSAHMFCRPGDNGQIQAVKTAGNPTCHLILRGGQTPNYYSRSVADAAKQLLNQQLRPQLMIDCSHGNSQKRHQNQLIVAEALYRQITSGVASISAVMVESFLEPGRQDISSTTAPIYGKSITDACIGWSDTLYLLDMFSEAVTRRRKVTGLDNGRQDERLSIQF